MRVDFNNNGSLMDPGEKVYAGPGLAPNSVVNGNFTIPFSATPGNKRMRIRLVYGSTTFTDCSNEFDGEAEDYNLMVIAATPCTGTPVAGTSAITSSCPTTVSLNGTTNAGSLALQWQSRPSCGGSWVDIAGATGYSYSIISLSQPTEYRAYVICTPTGLSDTSTITTVNSVTPCYCSSSASAASYEGITNVFLNTMSNSSTCGPTYTNYTSVPATKLLKGESYPFSIAITGCNSYVPPIGTAVFIDWNQNGSYSTTERVFTSTTNSTGTFVVSGTITVPATAVTGLTGMRIVAGDNNGTSFTGCDNPYYGEVEDYLVYIQYAQNVTGTGLVNYFGTYCSGQDITLTASAPGVPNPHYLWKKPNNGGWDTSATLTMTNVQVNQSGTYYVYTLSSNCPGGAPDTSGAREVTIQVNQTPNAPVVSPVIVYCQNDVFDSIPVYGQNIQWYTVPTGGVVSPAPFINTAVPNTATYYISQIVNGCEGPRAEVSITVAPKPAPPAVVSPVGYCQGNAADPLIATGQNVRWYTVATGGVGTTVTPTPTTNAQGSYTWYATQTVDGCESDRVPVVVNIGYVPNAVITTSRDFVCQYDTMTVGYFGNANDTATYTWTMPAGATILQGTGQGPLLVKFDSAGIRTVKLIVNNGGCVGPEATKDIPVHLSPRLAIDAQPDACVDEVVSLAVTYSTMGIDQYLWNFDGADTTYASLPRGPFGLKWSTPGLKTITVTAIDDGCVSLPVNDIVNVHALPDATITASSTDVCSGDSILFSAVYDPTASYQWLPYQFFGETNSSSVWGTVSTNTNVILNVTNNYNCRASDSIMVAAKPCCQVYFPTAFTPNNDGKNDRFRMLTIGKSKDSRTGAHEISVFKIQNRWGQTVYESADETRGWDGTFNGQPQDMGVYYFYVKYKCADGNYYEEKGEVTLVR
jgi:gliding motility-associated-like protein